MQVAPWLQELSAVGDPATQQQFIQEHPQLFDERDAVALKAQADQFLRSELERALAISRLLRLVFHVTDNSLYHALSLLAELWRRAAMGIPSWSTARRA